MSNAEPVGVAFVEVLPEAAGFKRKLETELAAQRLVAPGVAPSPGTAAATQQIRGLAAASGEAASAEALLARAQGELAAVTAPLAALQGQAAKAHVAAARAASADAFAQKALVAITEETSAATVAEIEALAAKTRALALATAAEERAALGTETHAAAALHAREAILAETASMTGLRGASLGLNPVFLAVTAGAIAFFKSMEQAAEFDEQMHLIEQATEASKNEMELARRVAVQYGHDLSIPGTTAVNSADAINLLVRSGLSLRESLVAQRGPLLLVAAGFGDLDSAVATTDHVMDAFKLNAEDTTRVADALATGAKFTQGNIAEFSNQLQAVAPVAATLGLSLENVNGLLLQLNEGGVSGSAAGTLLRQSLLRLAAGSKQVRDGLKGVGLSLDDLLDAQGQLRPDAFVRLADALANLDEKQRRQALTQIFSIRGIRAVLPLVEQGRVGYERYADAARKTGEAQEQAEARARGFSGQLRETKATVADTGRALGEVSAGPATQFLRNLNEQFEALDNLVFALGKGAGAIRGIGSAFADAVPGGERFLGVVGKIAFLQAFPTVGIAKGVNALIGHFRHGEEEIPKILSELNSEVDTALGDLVDTLKRRGNEVAAETGQFGSSLSTKIAVASVRGDTQAELAGLREQERRQLDLFNRLAAKPSSKEHDAAVQRARAQLEATRAEIESILSEQESKATTAAADAKEHAQKIIEATNAADQAIITSIGAEEARRQAAITHAQTSGTLRARIAAEVALRNFYRRAIEEVRKTVHAGEAKVAELQQLRLAKRAINDQIAADKQEQRDARAAAAQSAIESAQLDLELVQIRAGDSEDRTAASLRREVVAHQHVIAALKRAQQFTRKGTVEWKRLRNEIAQEQQAIRDLKKQRDAAQSEANFGALSFQFLQEQQGILSNFGPNFFPGGALSVSSGGGPQLGGVGTSSTAARPPLPGPNPNILSPFEHGRGRGARDAGGVGITTGQGNELIHQVRILVREMHLLRRGAGHPANRHSENWNRHVMDH